MRAYLKKSTKAWIDLRAVRENGKRTNHQWTIFKHFMDKPVLLSFAGPLRNAERAIASPKIREAHAAWPEAKRSLPFFSQPLSPRRDRYP